MLKLLKPIVFLDLETTGTEITASRIVEIACVKIFPDGRRETKYTLINPGMPIPAGASEIHGITDEKVKDAPLFLQIAKALFEWLFGCDLAGYNSDQFDIPMLAAEFERCRIEFPPPGEELTTIDGLRFERELNSHKLGETYKRRTRKELDGAHGAMADTLATIDVVLDQIGEMEMTPAEIQKRCQGDKIRVDLAGRLYQKPDGTICWNFGKHQDQPVTAVRHYADWVLGNDFPAETKTKLREAMKAKKHE